MFIKQVPSSPYVTVKCVHNSLSPTFGIYNLIITGTCTTLTTMVFSIKLILNAWLSRTPLWRGKDPGMLQSKKQFIYMYNMNGVLEQILRIARSS